MSNTGDNAGFLSARAARALQPALPYFTAFVKAQERLWCPEDQEGYIVVTVAENKLSHEILRVSMPRNVSLGSAALDMQESACALPCWHRPSRPPHKVQHKHQ